MHVRFFGVRGSCPCSSDEHRRYGGNTSCVTVEVDGQEPIILDLGTGLRPLGVELLAGIGAGTGVVNGARVAPVTPGGAPGASELQEAGRNRVAGDVWLGGADDPGAGGPGGEHWTALLTHLHWDHLIGLPFFPPVLRPGAKLDVYGPPQEGRSIQEVVDQVVKPPFFPVQVEELHGSVVFHDVAEGQMTVGSATVSIRQVPHVGTTLGFRIDAGGVAVAYLSDHQAPLDMAAVAPAVLELCDGADLVIHDAQYTEQEFVAKADWGHSTPAYAVHVAAEAGARMLALFHHDPMHDDDQIDRLVEVAAARPEVARLTQVVAAAEQMVVDVRPGSTSLVVANR